MGNCLEFLASISVGKFNVDSEAEYESSYKPKNLDKIFQTKVIMEVI